MTILAMAHAHIVAATLATSAPGLPGTTLATPAALHQLTNALVHATSHRAANPANTSHRPLEDIAHRVGDLATNISNRLETAIQGRV